MTMLIPNNNLLILSSSTPKKYSHSTCHCQLVQRVKLFGGSTHQNYILKPTFTPMSKFTGLKITSPFNLTNKYLRSRSIAGSADHCFSQVDLRPDSMPKHVAIILDGSRRWHKAHGKPLSYKPCFEAHFLFADLCVKWGIGTASSFVLSLKNLERGKDSNDVIFRQFEQVLEDKAQQLKRKGIKVCVIGERRLLPQTLQNKITQVEEATRDGTKLELILAICYAGTQDIVNATRNLCKKVSNGELEAKVVDNKVFENELSTGTSGAPHVDLLIRTGGRLRVSDFLIWQIAQAEFYFTDVYAPDFGEHDFIMALRFYQQREEPLASDCYIINPIY